MSQTATVSSVRRTVAVIALLGSLAATLHACASTGASGRSTVEQPRSGRVLSSQELAEVASRSTSLYDAVSILRPWYLQPFLARGAGPSYAAVYVDGLFHGPVGTLRQIPLRDVREVRLVRGADATITYGAHRPEIILEVITRASPPGRAF